MSTSVDLSTDLQDWIRDSGMYMRQGSQAHDGRTVLWNKGGEVRYFIELLDGWYVITSSDRMSEETYEFAATSMTVIENYLFGYFGGSVRSAGRLPRIRKPFERDELRPEYSLGKMLFAGRERSTLVDLTGTVIAIAGVEDLVELSHYLTVTVDAIKSSFLSPDGKPLFSLWSD